MAALTTSRRNGHVKPKQPPPDEQYIRGFWAWAETHYQDDDDQIDLMRKVREMLDPPILPDDLKVDGLESTIQDPTITDEIARVVATLSMREPSWTVTPPDPETDLAQINSTLREHFFEELFRFCGTRSPGLSTFHTLVDACVGDGGAVVKWVYNPDRWEPVFQAGDDPDTTDEDYEKAKKKAGPPLSRIPVDVRTWYPLWEGDRLIEVLERSERPFFPLLRRYGLHYSERDGFGEGLGPPLGHDTDESLRYPSTVDFYEFWDDTYVSYLCDTGHHKKMLKQFEHGLGRVPYFFAPGLMMNHWRGRKCGVGVGYNKQSLCRFRSFLLSLMIQAVARVSAAPLTKTISINDAEDVEGRDESPDKDYPVPLGQMVPLREGERIDVVELPGIPDATKEMLAVTSKLIDELNSPRTNPNVGGDLAGAGYAIQAVLTEGKTRPHPFISSLERMFEEETYFVSHVIVNKIKETVWVRRQINQGKPADPGMQWMGIGPDDLDEAVGVRVTLDPEPATSKIVEERYVGELLDRGLMSEDQAMAYLHLNPDEVRIGKIMDRWRKEGWYIATMDRMAMQRIRRGDILAERVLQVAQQGLMPGMDQLAAMQGGFGQPMAQPPNAAPGGPVIPDAGMLTASPGGVGATPAPSGGGPYLPGAAMAAGVQSMGQ